MLVHQQLLVDTDDRAVRYALPKLLIFATGAGGYHASMTISFLLVMYSPDLMTMRLMGLVDPLLVKLMTRRRYVAT